MLSEEEHRSARNESAPIALREIGAKLLILDVASCGGAIEVLSTTYPYFVRLPSSHKVA